MATVVRNKLSVFCIWLSAFLLLTITKSNAQRESINLQKTVVIATGPHQLDSLLHLINKQTGAKFSLNTKKFPASKKIYITNNKQSINSLLSAIKRSTGIYYAVLGDHIILLDNPPAENLSKPAVVKTKPVHESHRQTIKKPANDQNRPDAVIITPRNTPIQIHNTFDSTIVVPIVVPHGDSLISHFTNVKRLSAHADKSSSTGNSVKEKRSSEINLFVKGGLATDDVFYCSPTIQLGLPYFYGIASWNTNFNISELRYGIGFSIPVKEQWKLHLQASTGKLSSSPSSFSLFDSTSRRWKAKSALHMVALLAEANISNRFTIQFGPTVNIMRIDFYKDGKKTSPGITGDSAIKRFKLLRPVYTISNNYSASSSQATKIWIGLQVAIFYNLNLSKKE